MGKKTKQDLKCYLCGATEDLTRDHVPPDGFFPPPKPSNLITVPCCRKCNDSYKADDEAFRVLVTAPPNISKAGEWVQQNRVFESSFKRSPALARNVAASIGPAKNGMPFDTLTLPNERGDRFLIRLTKGLLAHCHPDFPRDNQIFRVRNFTLMDDAGFAALEALRDASIYDQRGDGVFQFRHDVSLEQKCGFWLFCFYEASLFAVQHFALQPLAQQ